MKKGLLILLLIAVALGTARLAFPAPPRPSAAVKLEKVERLRLRAIAAHRAGDHERAVESYRAWAALEPRNPLVLKDLMWEFWGRDRFEEAAAAARRVLELRPQDVAARGVLERLPEALGRASLAGVDQDIVRLLAAGRPPEAAASVYRQGVAAAARLAELRPGDPRAWNALGRMQAGLGQGEAALESYQNSLALKAEQPSIVLAAARLRFEDRDFEPAARSLAALASSGTLPASGYALLAKAWFWAGRHEESLRYWDQALELFPQSPDLAFQRAWALWRAGAEPEALRQMRRLYEERGQEKAFQFLLEDSLRRRDRDGAVRLLEGRLADPKPADADGVMLLASLYDRAGRSDRSRRLLDRYLELRPEHQEAWLRRADLALNEGRRDEARRCAEKALPLNAANPDVHELLAQIAAAAGRPRLALEHAARALALDPTEPSLILAFARRLRQAGQRRRAGALLEDWVERNQGSAALPILLYHGLTASANDPLLAYDYHYRTEVFADHMRALREGGYRAVTAAEVAAWLKGEAELPARPVWITFDDGRLDSFQQADPILDRCGMKATMFVALANTEGSRPPGYASWSMMRRWQESGRWELESHGGLAHMRVPSGPGGARGLFLINRLWRGEAGGLEPWSDWRDRVERDFRRSQDSHLRRAGRRPIAFAFPQGNFGQTGDNGNTPDASSVNLALAGKFFRLACVQDRFGINVRGRDPLRLKRVEPGNAWTGEVLLRHFQDDNPAARMRLQLFEWGVEDGRLRRAAGRLEELRRGGLSPARLLDQESYLRLAAGDIVQGGLLARRAAMLETLPETRRRVSSYVAQDGLAWVPGFVYERDNQGRRNWLFDQTIDVGRAGPVKWSLRHQRGEFMRDGSPAIADNAGGVAVEGSAGLFQRASAEALFHALAGPARDAYSLWGGLESKWRDGFETRLQAGRSIYGTAEALARDIAVAYGDARARWNQAEGPWKAEVRGRLGSLSDGNRRATAELELSRQAFAADSGRLRGVYRLTFDDMKDERPEYYSPRRVRANALGFELSARLRDRLELKTRYLPSFVQERGAGDGFSHNVSAELSWRIRDRWSATPSYEYYATPSYRDHRGAITLSWRFEPAPL
ncbi:MAG: tetratricopeptide repeat protein [Elusimicrobia bacterium]|nr:tetratricopeptide repeat protein [Elusimicrobiota bacterium]